MAGRVVGNDLVGNFLLGQFPRRQSGALKARTGFVAINMKLPALFLRGIHRCCGAANIHKGQPARIAMSEHGHAIANELCPVTPNLKAMTHILVCKFLCGRQCQGLAFFNRFARQHRGADLVHGIHRINRRRTRSL